MKYKTIVVSSIISLALLSILSLLVNVHAQTNSPNQTTPAQPNQAMNLTTQALMKVNIADIKNSLMNAKVAIVNGNFEEALTGVRDVETQLLLIDPSPTKFLSDLHKVTNAISKSDIVKSLDAITKVQVDILKAENLLFKTAMANPQVLQQFNSMEHDTGEEDY